MMVRPADAAWIWMVSPAFSTSMPLYCKALLAGTETSYKKAFPVPAEPADGTKNTRTLMAAPVVLAMLNSLSRARVLAGTVYSVVTLVVMAAWPSLVGVITSKAM